MAIAVSHGARNRTFATLKDRGSSTSEPGGRSECDLIPNEQDFNYTSLSVFPPNSV